MINVNDDFLRKFYKIMFEKLSYRQYLEKTKQYEKAQQVKFEIEKFQKYLNIINNVIGTIN